VDADRLEIDLKTDADPVVASLRGELDIVTAELCRQKLTGVIDEGAKSVRLELGGLAFVDSSGLGALVGIHHHAESAGASLELVGVSSQVRRLMEITRLDELFTISE
jgi:anti-sigma B factor antagonist